MEPIPTLPAPQRFESKPNKKSAMPAMTNAESTPNTRIEQPHETVSTPRQTKPVPQSDTNDVNSASPSNPSPLPSQSTGSTPNPAIADDVDVIEKEWVDRAKKIVSATREDPHQQEKEVSKLQADYLFKRYGKQVKLTE